MEIEIKKILYKVLPFVLCVCIVSGASAPAYADNSTSAYSYYKAGSTLNPYTEYSGKNSADMIGRLLDVSSYNQSMIYNRLLQMSSSGSDLTTVNSYITAIDDKLGVIRDSLGIGNSLNNVLVNQDSNLVHLNTIINKLSYWDNNHARSYDLSEMIFNMMNYNNSIADNTTTISAITSGIKSDTSNIVDIKSLLNSNVSVPWSYFYRYYDSQNNENMPTVVNGNGLLNLNFYKAGSGVTLRVQQNVQNYNANPLQAIGVLNNNVVNLGSLLYGFYRYYPRNVYNSDTNNLQELVTSNGSGRAYSIMDSLAFIHNDLLLPLAKLQFFLADDQSIQAKKANVNNENAFLSNFTGSGSASASPSDFGAVKDSIVDLKAGFNGGASSSDTFGFLSGDSNAWDWFTQDIANDLDRTQGSNTRLLRGSSDVAYDTPLLDSYYTSILSILGGDN